jgi:hypothetical protein
MSTVAFAVLDPSGQLLVDSVRDSPGERITNADKAARVRNALKNPAMEGWSQHRIAEACNVTQKMVSEYMQSTDTQYQSSATTQGKDGKHYPAKKKKTTTSPPAGPNERSSTMSIEEHRRGVPERSPLEQLGDFAWAMRTTDLASQDDECTGCGAPTRAWATWRPDEPLALDLDHSVAVSLYSVCDACWRRMQDDLEFTAIVEHTIRERVPPLEDFRPV